MPLVARGLRIAAPHYQTMLLLHTEKSHTLQAHTRDIREGSRSLYLKRPCIREGDNTLYISGHIGRNSSAREEDNFLLSEGNQDSSRSEHKLRERGPPTKSALKSPQ